MLHVGVSDWFILGEGRLLFLMGSAADCAVEPLTGNRRREYQSGALRARVGI